MALKVVPATGPYESRQAALIAIQIVLVTIALVIYSLRIYTRIFILRSIGTDDYIMGAAMVFSILLAINACITTKYGWGTHLYSVPPQDFGPELLLIWISELLFTFTTSLVKLSILFFYLRLAATTTYRRVIYGSIAFLTAWLVSFTCVVLFQCHPISAYWDPTSNQCFNPDIAFGIHGVTNSLTDVYVFVLPMQMVWKLYLPRRQRIGLLVIFGVGFLVCVAGALRLYYTIATNSSADSPWEGFNLWTWEGVEVNLGIVCASTPCLKSLVARIGPRIFTSSYHDASFWQSGGSNSAPAESHRQVDTGQSRGDGGMFSMQRKGFERGYILRSTTLIRSDGTRVKNQGESQDSLTEDRHIVVVTSFDCKTADDVV